MKSDYITRAKKFVAILDEIISEYGDDIELGIMMYNMIHHRRVIFAHGLTRYAFITSDYVIKVDYDPFEISRFGGCENEMMVYAQAEEDGMEHLFAKITEYKYNGCSYYIMPRIKGIGRFPDDADFYMTEEELTYILDVGICDLHNGNYGWRDGHVCLIDYGCTR